MNILQLKSDLSAMLHGTSINKVANVTNLINRAARQVLLDVDFIETKKLVNIPSPIFDNLYDYPLPADLKLNKVVDIRDINTTSINANYDMRRSKEFNLKRHAHTFAIDYVNGTKVLRFAEQQGGSMLIDSLDEALTWVPGGDVVDLITDSVNRKQGAASLQFGTSGISNSLTLTTNIQEAVDMTSLQNKSSFFIWVYVPDQSYINSMTLCWGSDENNYFDVTTSSPHDRGTWQLGWNLVRFNWSPAANKTLTPDVTDLQYFKISIDYTGEQSTGWSLDWLANDTGKQYSMVYYSTHLFKDATTNITKEEMSDDSDVLVLEGSGIQVFLAKLAELAAQQVQQQGGVVDLQYFAQAYLERKNKYTAMFPSDAIQAKQFWYRMPKNHRRFGRSRNILPHVTG